MKNTFKRVIRSLGLAAALVSTVIAPLECQRRNRDTQGSLEQYVIQRDVQADLQLPDIVSQVQEYRVPSSKNTLVYIRQLHPPTGSIGSYRNGRQLITRLYDVHENMEHILDQITEKQGIEALYVEGLNEQNEEKVNNVLADIAKTAGPSYNNWALQATATPEVTLYGAASSWAIKNKEKIHGADRLDLAKKAYTEVLRNPNTNSKKVFDDREDYLIGKISEDFPEATKKPIVFVYGAAHDFRNNVASWNIDHPNHTYSLVVITPESVTEEYQK